MKDVRQKFKSISPLKKILFFNVYSIILAVFFCVLSLILFSLFDSFYDEIAFFQAIIINLSSITIYITSIAWSYIMVALALHTELFQTKVKK
ncbi:MAG: hypothetical protein WC135_08715 [Bacteroidales bacterium]